MKNKALLSLIVFVAVLFVGTVYVNATSLFNKDWGVTNNNVLDDSNLVSTSKGTLVLGINESNNSSLYLYDENGKKLYSKDIVEELVYLTGFENGDSFYLIGVDENGQVLLDKYSNKLEKQSSKETGYYIRTLFLDTNIKNDVLYIFCNVFSVDDENLGFALAINMKEVTDIKVINTENDFISIFPNVNFDQSKYEFNFFKNGILSVFNKNDDTNKLIYNGNDYSLSNTSEKYVDATRMGNYVLGFADSSECIQKGYSNEQHSCSFVDVFDSSMNFIERIDISGGDKTKTYIANHIVATSNNSFLVTSRIGDFGPGNYDVLVSKYSLPYNIETKTNGHGNIKVSVKKALSGTVVTFTITPEEGYVLSVVKVTDANGNVVYFKDYTFTMPSADVTVEATFVKAESKEKNPDTSTKGTIAFALFITVGGIFLLSKYIISVKRYE